MPPALLGQAAKAANVVVAERGDLARLRKACQGMESSFLRQMLSAMRQTVSETHVGDDTGGDTMRGMADDALADRLAERGTLGIADRTYKLMAKQVLNKAFQGKH